MGPLANLDSNQQIALVGALLMLTMLLMGRLKSRRRRDDAWGPPETAVPGASRMLRGEVDEILSELEKVSRSLQAKLETRIQTLDRLNAEADRKIEELRRLVGAGPSAPAGAPAAAPIPPPAPAAPHAEVYRLADEGLDPRAIAQKLKRDVGEIQLILNLRGVAR